LSLRSVDIQPENIADGELPLQGGHDLRTRRLFEPAELERTLCKEMLRERCPDPAPHLPSGLRQGQTGPLVDLLGFLDAISPLPQSVQGYAQIEGVDPGVEPWLNLVSLLQVYAHGRIRPHPRGQDSSPPLHEPRSRDVEIGMEVERHQGQRRKFPIGGWKHL